MYLIQKVDDGDDVVDGDDDDGGDGDGDDLDTDLSPSVFRF